MKHCKGCYRQYKFFCIYARYIEDCPCGICLIKGVCQVGCDEFMDFIEAKQPNLFEVYENKMKAKLKETD